MNSETCQPIIVKHELFHKEVKLHLQIKINRKCYTGNTQKQTQQECCNIIIATNILKDV